MALIDTGASSTCLTAKVINQVGLSPIGKQPVGGVHGQRPTNIYNFQVGIPFPTVRSPRVAP
jgi:predicted aspartyl protease